MSSIINKILLINPPSEFKTPVMPLGLAYIAAYLKAHRVEVSIIDCWADALDFDGLKNRLLGNEADIIGIYMLSPYYNNVKTTIEICRKVFPHSTIVVGGCHPSARPFETIKDIPQLDVCIVGEGEITMYELVKSLQEKTPLSNIDGIVYREGEKIKTTKPREFIKNLDELPFPARELFPLQKYKTHPPYGRKNPYFTMMASRGCPFHCAFCSKDVFKNNYRAPSPKRVCDEIEELITKYGAKEIHFYDDNFTLGMKRAEEICDEILKRKIKIAWSCATRVNLVNEPLLKKMKEAGCWLISYGVESGNQNILNAVNKGYAIEQVMTAFAMTKRLGITTLGFFIVGLPGETKETIQDTSNLIKKIRPDFICCAATIVYPDSNFSKLIKKGEYSGRLRPLNQGENFAGTFTGKGNLTIFESNLTFEELRKAVKKINQEFYLNFSYIFQSLKKIRSFSDFKYYLRGATEIIKSLTG